MAAAKQQAESDVSACEHAMTDEWNKRCPLDNKQSPEFSMAGEYRLRDALSLELF